MSRNSFMETLESRTLLSASPVLFNGTVLHDRAVIRADINKFRADAFACGAKLFADLKRGKHLLTPGDTNLDAPLQQLKNDAKALAAQLKADHQAEATTVLTDEATIRADIKQIHKDKKDPTALAADQTKLTNDRITLQDDLLAALDTRIADRQAAETTLSNDTQALVTAVDNDPEASAALKSVVDKFAADRVTCLDKLTADLQNIATARTKLANDLAALQST